MNLRTALFLAALAAPAAAHAKDAVAVELIGKAMAGQGRPGLVIFANRPVVSAKATLQPAAGGETVVLQSGSIPAGSKKELLFDAPVGRSSWSGTLHVQFIDGTEGEMPLSFDVLVSEGLKIKIVGGSDEEVAKQVRKGSLSVELTGAADKCEYDVIVAGKATRHGWARFAGEPAGTPLQVTWPTHGEDDDVIRVAVTCHDREGFFSPTAELYPFRIEIPHEDVVFASGRSEVQVAEAPKLDAVIPEIGKVLKKYETGFRLAKRKASLYVMGCTDTVGDPASNLSLSQARARSIAEYFRRKGVRLDIHYIGLGEGALAVETPDETDEVRNRRAVYTIALEAPMQASWKKL